MIWDQINRDWTPLASKLKGEWEALTNDDLVNIAGRKDQLIGVLQARYCYSKERAELELDSFIYALTS